MENIETLKTTVAEQLKELNDMILSGQILDAFEKFYANDITMQENENNPTIGKDACRKNEEAFVSNITEFRGARVKNILISGNISVVEWEFDYTHKEWGERRYTQLAVQRWNEEGQIINEKFYYSN